jgi:hypothetical protein
LPSFYSSLSFTFTFVFFFDSSLVFFKSLQYFFSSLVSYHHPHTPVCTSLPAEPDVFSFRHHPPKVYLIYPLIVLPSFYIIFLGQFVSCSKFVFILLSV